MAKQLVIVIAGVTCGGKTTIANRLTNTFNDVSILHQDDFYYTNYEDHLESIPELNYHAWDKISAYDMDKMMATIDSQTSNILVLEGILLLDDIRIFNLADLTFFIVLDKKNCRDRRVARTYLPPEPSGYFDKYAWPEYVNHLEMIKKKKPDVIFLNGSDSIDFNTSIVVNHINQLVLNLK
ncbi:nicotinamide riboside kinase 1 isoform X1 [Myzus persicae]|uniref:nicotinamide riboside kinase 1 isoform X1 n=1 Tax=Myzus persicae TaxID=13164 RepID=UPI000B9386AC|nr:nicotinamide riboside kinase 1 isoform X1 [Myzus persicae]XP_022168547.1 nicotinamide riboside kinase 1 isoform X1 [Myzus persicae]